MAWGVFNQSGATRAAARLASDSARWYDDTPCRGFSELFDQLDARDVYKIQYVSRTFCATCPVQRECLEDALEYGAMSTVRGGLFFDQSGKPRNVIRTTLDGRLMFAKRG